MRRRPPALVVLLALALLGGAACSKASDDPTDRARSRETTSTTLEELDPPEVELIDAGAEPRQRLRLRPPRDCVARTTQDQELTQTVDVGRGPQPSTNRVQYDLTSRCTKVTDERIEFTTTYDDVRVVGGGAPGDTLLDAVTGLVLTTTIDHRGNVLHVEVPPLETSDASGLTQQILDGLGDQLHQTATPFPEEAVGVGARWRVASERRSNGIPSTAVTEFRLVSIDGTRVEASLSSRLTFVRGEFQLETPMGPTGAEVLSGELAGSGTVVWDLEGVATTSDQTVEGTSVMALTGPNRTEVEQTQRQRITSTER